MDEIAKLERVVEGVLFNDPCKGVFVGYTDEEIKLVNDVMLAWAQCKIIVNGD